MDPAIIVGALIAIVGALIGVGVRRTAKFLYPYDFFSLTIYASLIICMTVLPILSERIGIIALDSITVEQYGVFIVGYFVGYCIDGRLNFVMIRMRFPAIKHSRGEPWVVYVADGSDCIALQNNRALFNRVFRKVHIPIVANAPFYPDATESTKYPLFPEFNVPIVYVESCDLVPLGMTEADKLKRRPPVRRAMRVRLAHGSMVSAEQLCYETDAVRMANESAADANRRLIGLTHYMKTAIPKIMINFLAEVYRKAPVMAFVETLDDERYPFWIGDDEIAQLDTAKNVIEGGDSIEENESDETKE